MNDPSQQHIGTPALIRRFAPLPDAIQTHFDF